MSRDRDTALHEQSDEQDHEHSNLIKLNGRRL